MANPQIENGYTKIANEILEALAGIRICGEARQVLDVILRKTYGFNKKKDRIALSQFSLATGLKRPNVCRAINKLTTMQIVIKIDTDKGEVYLFQKDFDKWKPLSKKITLAKGVSKLITSIIQKDNKGVSKKIHTKDNIQKKHTKEIAEVPSAPWVLEEKLQEMEKKENSHLDIIATFIREKPVKIENSKQLSGVIGRYCRVAQKLSGAYTNKQIFGVVEKIKQDNENKKRRGQEQIDYTLETVYKYLTK